MQYTLTEEQLILRDTVRRIAKEKIAPGAAERDEAAEWSWEMVDVLKQNGLFGCDFPEKYGGAQMGMMAFCLAVEEVAKACGATSVYLLVHELGSIPLMLAASDEMKDRLMPEIASAESLIAFALTEPGAGSDVAALKTKAVKKGDRYVLNGQKQFISHADVAKYICVAAVTDPDQKATKGLSVFVVDRESDGLSIGKKEHKMGIRASSTCEVILEDCEVPADRILGKEGDGFAIIMKTLDFTRPCVAAQALGIAQGALDYAVGYAKERQQFGRPIMSFEGLNWMLADMDARCEAARQLVYKTAAVYQEVPKDLSRVPMDAIRLSAMSKLVAADMAMSVTTDAVQVLGGYGYVKEYPVERMMRDAKITQIYEGTSQVQKIVIASTL